MINSVKNKTAQKHLKRLAELSSASAKTPAKSPTVGNSSFGTSLGAAVVALGSGSTARLVILLIAIVGSTATVGVLAIRRQRSLH